ncbi:MAG: imidazoleglycerol-phosphate dehydratase HisB [Anaerolineales bacterium]|nr:imidazoleglycerol-phosphate dehydratase HisB [Anaerolineales bacterium]
MRTAQIERKTKETDIQLELNLDGDGKAEIDTGIGFFDHMLTQIAVHGLFDIRLETEGDLFIDPHHTIEDCGLALGEALTQVLGDKRGITRMATSFVPMDEALAQVVLDLSGRPYAVIQTAWTAPDIGGIPTSLIEHFFESFAVTGRANLHASVLYGRDNHHMAEALFKALGRALDAATQIDPRRAGEVPSSKGVLA